MHQSNGGGKARKRCPRCYGERVWRDGRRRTRLGTRQRFLCRDCGFRFDDEIIISTSSEIGGERQVCVTDCGAKNLIVAGEEKRATGEISENSILLEFAWWMKKQGFSQQTIDGRKSIFKTLLNRSVDVDNPESVKEYLASQDCSQGRKRNIVHAVSSYYESKNKTWNPPRYNRIPKIPWVPQEKLIDQLIAGCLGKYQPFQQLLKETGMRPGEAWQLKWNDVDYATKQVRVTPEKGSNSRVLPISKSLFSMLSRLNRNSEYVFKKGLYRHFSGGFRRHRKKIAQNLGNLDIERINLKTFRHFKGTIP